MSEPTREVLLDGRDAFVNKRDRLHVFAVSVGDGKVRVAIDVESA